MKMALEDLEPGKLVEVKEINGFQEKIPFQYHEHGYYITRIPTSLSSKNAIEVLAGMVMVVEDVYAIVKKPPTANKTIIL